MARYRKKPVVIEAFQYDGDMIDSFGQPYVPEWAITATNDNIMYYDGPELFIRTLEETTCDGGRLCYQGSERRTLSM